MAKHTQTIRRQIGDELFECIWPFCGIGAYRVNLLKFALGKRNLEKSLIEQNLTDRRIH